MATQAGEEELRSGIEPSLSLAAMRIVRLLTGRPPAGIHDLAASLGVTATAVNEQMKRLLACGAVVRYQTPTRGRGRPKFLYSTAPAATAFGFVARPPLVPALWRAVRAIGGLQLLRQMIERGAAELTGDVIRLKRPGDHLLLIPKRE